VALPDALGPSGASPTRVRFTCAREGNSLVAATDDRQEALRLSPSLGWRLLDPFAFELPRFLWFGAIWLMALAFPAGYWIGCMDEQTGAGATVRGWPTGPLVALGALGIAFLAGLTIVPMVAGTAPAAWWEWASAAAGAIAGSGAAWLWKARGARLLVRRGGASVTAVSDAVQ
jgi:hypothetical protein